MKVRFYKFIFALTFCSLSMAEDGGVLNGIASLIGASTPIVTTAVQASSSVAQANIAAATGVFQAQTAADVARYQADNAATVSLAQTFISAQVAESNNRHATIRMAMQQEEIADQFQKTISLDREKFLTEMELKFQSLAYEEKNNQLKLEAEKQRILADNVKAGIATGVTDVTPAQTSLTTTKKSKSQPRLLASLRPMQGSIENFEGRFLKNSLASGSSRMRRNFKSDLSQFKNSNFPARRSFIGDSNLIPHVNRRNVDSSSEGSSHSHTH